MTAETLHSLAGEAWYRFQIGLNNPTALNVCQVRARGWYVVSKSPVEMTSFNRTKVISGSIRECKGKDLSSLAARHTSLTSRSPAALV